MTRFNKKYLYLDTNVIIDYACRREPHFTYAEKIFKLSENKQVKIAVGALTFSTFFYLTSKILMKDTRIRFSRFLRENTSVLALTSESVEWAEKSNFSDFEDAIQNHIAESNGCTTIITRNKKDFKKSDLPVLTPEEFLATQEI